MASNVNAKIEALRVKLQKWTDLSSGLHWTWERYSDPATPVAPIPIPEGNAPSPKPYAFDEKIDLWHLGQNLIETHPPVKFGNRISDSARISGDQLMVHVYGSSGSASTHGVVIRASRSGINNSFRYGLTAGDEYLDPIMMINHLPDTLGLAGWAWSWNKDGSASCRSFDLFQSGNWNRVAVYDRDARLKHVQLLAKGSSTPCLTGDVTQYRVYAGITIPSEIHLISRSKPTATPLRFTLKLLEVGPAGKYSPFPSGFKLTDYRNQVSIYESEIGAASALADSDPKITSLKGISYTWNGTFPTINPGDNALETGPGGTQIGVHRSNTGTPDWKFIVGGLGVAAIAFGAAASLRSEKKRRAPK